MNIKGPQADVGIIVARFQTPQLTVAHRDLIDTVRTSHSKFAVILGNAQFTPSRKNPLDWQTRHAMIQENYPGTIVLSIYDQRDDRKWSQQLDTVIRSVFPHEDVVLYGGRDSFISHYFGKYTTISMEGNASESGTEARKRAFHEVRETEDFRRGVCYATANQYNKVVPTVDVAIVRPSDGFLLLGRKPNETSFRFIGGFVEESLELAGRREVMEETNVTLNKMEFIGSTVIDDWRYAGTGDKIMTSFFLGTYFDSPEFAGDDISEIRWFDPRRFNPESQLVPEHHVLWEMYAKHTGLRGTVIHPIEGTYEVSTLEYTTQHGSKVFKSVPEEMVKL